MFYYLKYISDHLYNCIFVLNQIIPNGVWETNT